ncbi:hypothetical protein AWE51_15190 [Aquimarina aggregata]|uniref:Uncharacterized protein n=1 Tax=Aquimarina aggregata TaxID=1642818 RepID=A0A162CL86_9FLAO|nr:hypothetical protein [Aquimarina aggregata]KZS38924.1 hypothetical protein AWE51_15190 [Aquimarina aggregata]
MAECNVQFGEVTEIDRIPCIIFECDKITEIIVYPNERMLARLKIQGEAGGWLKFETSYDLTFEYSEEEMELTTSSWSVERGDVILTNITAKSEGDFFITTKMNGKETGRVKVVSKEREKDIFLQDEVDNLMSENNEAIQFNRNNTVPGNGYCIMAADRGLGALLNDTENFYTEPNLTSQGGNGVSLRNSSTRSEALQNHGYIKDHFEIRTDNYYTNNEPTRLASSLKERIEQDIDKKPGFHVYYYSMHGEYHVMLLLMDNRNPCNRKYSILDQGYVRELDLDFDSIDEKFLELAVRFWNNKNQHAKNILMWKMQQK